MTLIVAVLACFRYDCSRHTLCKTSAFISKCMRQQHPILERENPSSLFYLFHSFLSWHRSPRPTVFSLDQSYLGKTSDSCSVCVCECVCRHGLSPYVGPHLLAGRIMSYKPLLKVDLFTLLLACGDNKNSMTLPLLGPLPGVEKRHVESIKYLNE